MRTFTLAPENAATRFTMREVYSGPLAPLIGRSIPGLDPSFTQFANRLRARAESGDNPS